MNVTATPLPGVLIIEPVVMRDERGFVMETYQAARYREIGLGEPFVQHNLSHAARGVLRGLHFQEPHPQGKLAQTVRGNVFAVVVDVRRGAPTFSRWFGLELSEQSHRQLWIPPGFAHGYCVLSEVADVAYNLTVGHAGSANRAVLWNDPDIGIGWPVGEPILSARDRAAPRLRDAQILPGV
jgi:dTDP-4-dehydrorhamnose 3,5-epimerase